MDFRVGQYSGVSLLTGKKSKAKITTTIKDRVPFFHTVFLEDFKILVSSYSKFQFKTKEGLLISGDSQLKRNEKTLQLYLFD